MRHPNTAMLDAAYEYQQSQKALGAPAKEEALPHVWTDKYVEKRLVEAFGILRRLGGKIGPAEFGSNWPSILSEVDLKEEKAVTRMREELRKIVDDEYAYIPPYMANVIKYLDQKDANEKKNTLRESERPTKDEISRMEEALSWPMQHLADDPKMADALTLWAFAKAWGRNITGMLRERNKRAVEIAKVMERQANERRHVLRLKEATETATWANMKRWLSDGSAAARERIIHNAVIRLERKLAKSGLAKPRITFRPSDAMPDKVMSQTKLDHHRYMASHLIATKLNRGMVRVR